MWGRKTLSKSDFERVQVLSVSQERFEFLKTPEATKAVFRQLIFSLKRHASIIPTSQHPVGLEFKERK